MLIQTIVGSNVIGTRSQYLLIYIEKNKHCNQQKKMKIRIFPLWGDIKPYNKIIFSKYSIVNLVTFGVPIPRCTG